MNVLEQARRIGRAADATGEDPRHDQRTAALLGLALGIAFTICFLTGLWSHVVQHPPSWFTPPSRPAGLYRVTQGLHVLTGIASIPLLLAKLWSVSHHLVAWPPVRSPAHALERLSLVPLVGGAIFQLWSGVANIDLWYPLPFYFPAAHETVAWITMAGLVMHIGAKLTITRAALQPMTARADELAVEAATAVGAAPDHARRRFLTLVGAGSATLVALTAGMTVPGLERLALLAPRRPSTGPQGVPVNKTAAEANVVTKATDVTYRLVVTGAVTTALSLDLATLRAMPQREAELPISCVEGWSASARWRGVPLRDLLDLAGARPGAEVTVRSLEEAGLYGQSDLLAAHVTDADTLLALELNGEVLDLDHGYPLRLIAPNRPGVQQTKWLAEIEVR